MLDSTAPKVLWREIQSLRLVRRRAKTLEELRADLKAFELAYKREMACFMRNAVERMTTPASGRRISAKYKMKLPRLTRTVVVHGPADGASTVQPFRRRENARNR